MTRIQPVAGTTILDGDGNGIAELAADGSLSSRRALVYAGDLERRRVSALVASGARLVFSDSNRLRIIGATTLTTNTGPTLEAGDPIAPDTPTYDLFPRYGTAGRTVATYGGLKYLRTPGLRPRTEILPEDRPFAALDGRLDTAWLADAAAPLSARYTELELASPHPVRSIAIYPLREPLGDTTSVAISVNGGPERTVQLTAGWNDVPINTTLRRLRIRITRVLGFGSAGGISELRIPGLRVRESLRLPTTLSSETSGLDLSHNDVSVLLARTTADFPYRESPQSGELQLLSGFHETDAERDIRRIVTLPADRSFDVSGWASISPTAPDQLIDRLGGMSAGWRFSSSSRFEGVPLRRASSAFDRNLASAWVAPFQPNRRLPWIQWSTPHPVRVTRLRLVPGSGEYEFPTIVRISTPRGQPQVMFVRPDRAVVLHHPVRTRELRLQVLAVSYPVGPLQFGRFLNAVAIAEIQVPGLHPPAPSRLGSFVSRCGAMTISAGGERVRLQAFGTIRALDQGEPLALHACGLRRTLTLQPGSNELLAAGGGVLRPDHVALNSPAPVPPHSPPAATLRSSGVPGQDRWDGIRPEVSGPSWLVLGEGYSHGWRAWCRDASGHEHGLGAPVPIDGYANGWTIDRSCREARMYFAPQSTTNLVYVASATGCVLLLLLALGVRAPARLRRGVLVLPGAVWVPALAGEDRGRRLAWRTAVVVGVLSGVLTSEVFAIRFGVVFGSLTVILLRTRLGAKKLFALAGIALAAIPVLYLVRPAPDNGGFSFNYSNHHILAHWVGAGALCLLLAGALLQARILRRRRLREPAMTQLALEERSSENGRERELEQPTGVSDLAR